MEQSGASLDYSRLPKALNCDFLALTHLLRNTADVKPGYSKEQWLLILYFRVQFLSLAVRRSLRVGERKAALRLTSILQYFANVVGERMNEVEFGNSPAASAREPLIHSSSRRTQVRPTSQEFQAVNIIIAGRQLQFGTKIEQKAASCPQSSRIAPVLRVFPRSVVVAVY